MKDKFLRLTQSQVLEQYPETDELEDFAFFIDLQKSVQDDPFATDDKKHDRIVYLTASTESIDVENERMLRSTMEKALGWFLKYGKITYQHLTDEVRNDPRKESDAIIGEPLDGVVTDDGRMLIKAFLYSGHDVADNVWSALDSGGKWQASVGGMKALGREILEKGRKVRNIVKAFIDHIAITPWGKNATTEVTIQKYPEFSRALAKSLSATPVSTDVSQKTGGDAITKNSIDGDPKEKDASSGKEKPTFKTYREAFRYYRDEKGLSVADANKKASDYFKSLHKSQTKETVMFNNIREAFDWYTENGVERDQAVELSKSMYPEEAQDLDAHLEELSKSDPNVAGNSQVGLDEESKVLFKSVTDSINGLQEYIQGIGVSDDDFEDLSKSGDLDDYDLYDEPEAIEVSQERLAKSIEATLRTENGIREVASFIAENAKNELSLNQRLFKAVGELKELINDSLTIKDEDGNPVPMAKAFAALASQSRGPQAIPFRTLDDSTKSNVELPTFKELNATLDKGLNSGAITAAEADLANAAWRKQDGAKVEEIVKKASGE